MKFDSILLNNAQRRGVDVREQHAVVDVLTDGGRVRGVVFEDNAGTRCVARCRYVVDASGHTSLMSRHAGERIYSKFFRNVAVFGYFTDGKRLPAPCSGNIFSVAFDKGWFWYIPLSDKLTSVGAVIGQEYAHVLRQGYAAALSELIAECHPIRDLLSEATRIGSGPYGEVRVRKDYSYCHSEFWRPGLVLIGDAACFIDPVFSSGVHLATYSALLAARSINTCLIDKVSEERGFAEFENRYRREYAYFYDFLVAFYDMNQDVDAYYWAARQVTNSEESANEAFIQLVAGAAGFKNDLPLVGEEFMQSRQGLGKLLFPEADVVPTKPLRDSDRRLDKRDRFMSGLLTEVSQIQLQAMMIGTARCERPLFEGGLVPSLDGFHWAEPVGRVIRRTEPKPLLP